MTQHTDWGPGAPASAPPSIGAHYTDTDTGWQYLAKGTASTDDWVKVWPPAGQGSAPIQGVAWATLGAPDDVDMQGVSYHPGFDAKVIGFGSSIWGSADGAGWSDRLVAPSGESVTWRTAVSGDSSMMLLTSDNSQLAYSSDGVNWATKAGPNATLTIEGVVVWRATQGDYFFLGTNTSTYGLVAYRSVDGSVWDDVSAQIDVAGGAIVSLMSAYMVEGAPMYFGTAVNLNTMAMSYATSSDGLVWADTGTALTEPTARTLAYSPTLGRHLIRSSSGLAYSDDNLASLQSVPAAGLAGVIFSKVIWCDDIEMFAASSLNQGDWGSKLLLSRDGIDWTPVGLPQFGDSLHEGSLPTDLVWASGPNHRKIVMSGTNSVTYHARMKG